MNSDNKKKLNLILFISAGGSTLADLQQALEDYLPVLLGLVKDGKSRDQCYSDVIYTVLYCVKI